MGKVIKLTLLTDISSCLIMLIVFTLSDNIGTGLYAGILTFGNILLPTLGAVLIYKLIKDKTTSKNEIGTIILQATLLTGIFTFGLYFWAAGEAYLFKTLTWTDISMVYDLEFSGFLPVVLTEAVVIPTLDTLMKD